MRSLDYPSIVETTVKIGFPISERLMIPSLFFSVFCLFLERERNRYAIVAFNYTSYPLSRATTIRWLCDNNIPRSHNIFILNLNEKCINYVIHGEATGMKRRERSGLVRRGNPYLSARSMSRKRTSSNLIGP